jgi:adenine-specific DNA-methyltransferase
MDRFEAKNKELLEEIEKLKKKIKTIKEPKKYGLVWEEEKEPEQIVLDCQIKIPILKEVKAKEIITDKQKPQNILIEGDNYHALSVLNYTHKKKIDVIYIDPPYNTGAKDWKYNNNYVDINDLYRHSKWLTMMSKRLWLAKNLLKEDGVLICTIDDNEVNHLGVLLEQIFRGYEIHCITIVHNPRGIQGNNFSYTHEYAFFVFRNGLKVIGTKQRDEVLEEELRDHGGESLRTDARNCFYPILVKNNQIIGFGKVPDKNYHPKGKNVKIKNGIIEVWPIDVKGVERKWVFALQTVDEIKDKLFVGEKKNGEIDIFRRKDTQKPRTVWTGQRYDASTFGSKIVNGLTGTTFPFPKSLYNTRDCLECVVKDRKNAIVLDYFAGSGTTGHAVMILNKEDDGNRKFILCTNNENNNGNGEGGIAEKVCYPRIKKVIEGHKDWPDITKIPANLGYFKTELLDIDHISHVSDEQKIKLTYRAGEMIALREGTFEEVEKDEWWQIFKDGTKYTAIYFKEDKRKLNELVKELSKLKEKVVLYIFSWGKNEYKNEFTEYKNIKVEDIPEPIIDVYKEVNRLS